MAGLLFLDTNVLIFGIDREHPMSVRVREWVFVGERLLVSAMAWSEFRCGPAAAETLQAWERLLGTVVVPIDRAIAERAADLFNLTGRRSRSLPDCLIAATAMRHKAPLATLNRTDFEPLLTHGLTLA